MTYWLISRVNGLLLIAALFAGGCKDVEIGSPLQSGSFELPVGIAVHPEGFALVLSSNFDLAHKSGSLRAIDLNLLAERIENPPQNPEQSFFEHREVILDNSAISVSNFASAIKLAVTDQGGLAAMTVRETNELILVDIHIGTDQQGKPTIDLQCWPDDAELDGERFPACYGKRHVLQLDNNAPFDVLLLNQAESGQSSNLTAFLSFLGSSMITVVGIPLEQDHVYSISTSSPGIDDLAYSPQTGLIFTTQRSSERSLFTMQYFHPEQEGQPSGGRLNLQSGLDNTGSQSVDFLEDGVTAALLVRNPNMLIYLDTSLDSKGIPGNKYLGHVLLDELPIRVKNHDNLTFISSTEGDTLYVVDAVTKRLMEIREDICVGPYDMDIYERDGLEWLLIACFEESKVAVLDVDENSDNFLKVLALVGS